MAGMQKLLETSDKFINPNFGSAFIFELRRDRQYNYYVKVLNKNDVYPGMIHFNTVKMNGI